VGSCLSFESRVSQEQVIRKSKLRETVHASVRLDDSGELLSSRAYQQIRDEILSGELSIGDVLSRRGLAKRLNMSFLPITEALKCLETEGLVESRPRIGTRVRIPTEQDIRDSNVIREALESQAARLCAQNITVAEKEQLRTSARHLDQLYKMCTREPGDSRFLFSVHTYHMQFHMRIAELARCPGLRRAIEKEQVLIFNWLYDMAADRRTQPKEFHSTLAEALCSGDPLVADTAMRAHIRYGLDQVLERLANYDNKDAWRLKNKNLEKNGKKPGTGSGEQGA
jgi:GntR family transcriptional regulator, rspAB operon transcriptional repressor